MKLSDIKQSRFEIRLSREDKSLFEEASQIAGYKTLSAFVLSSLREHANRIIKERDQILASQRDKEIFFNAVFSDTEPVEALKKASGKYLDSPLAK